MLLAWDPEFDAANNDAIVAGVDGWSEDDDFGRLSCVDDENEAPFGDFGDAEDAVVVGDGALVIPFPPLLRGAGGDPVNVGGVIGDDDTGGGNPPEEAAARDCAWAAAKLAANAGCNPGGRNGLSIWCCCWAAAACEAMADAMAAAAAWRKAGWAAANGEGPRGPRGEGPNGPSFGDPAVAIRGLPGPSKCLRPLAAAAAI